MEHPKGFFQPGVLALTREGRVLYRWRSVPSAANLNGTVARPTPTHAWMHIERALEAGEDVGDASHDDDPIIDQPMRVGCSSSHSGPPRSSSFRRSSWRLRSPAGSFGSRGTCVARWAAWASGRNSSRDPERFVGGSVYRGLQGERRLCAWLTRLPPLRGSMVGVSISRSAVADSMSSLCPLSSRFQRRRVSPAGRSLWWWSWG